MSEPGIVPNEDYSDLAPDQFKSLVTLFSAQTALTTFFVLAGVLLMVFAEPPLKWLAGGCPAWWRASLSWTRPFCPQLLQAYNMV